MPTEENFKTETDHNPETLMEDTTTHERTGFFVAAVPTDSIEDNQIVDNSNNYDATRNS